VSFTRPVMADNVQGSLKRMSCERNKVEIRSERRVPASGHADIDVWWRR
jgi:hypothetical protein